MVRLGFELGLEGLLRTGIKRFCDDDKGSLSLSLSVRGERNMRVRMYVVIILFFFKIFRCTEADVASIVEVVCAKCFSLLEVRMLQVLR